MRLNGSTAALAEPIRVGDRIVSVPVSIGVTTHPEPGRQSPIVHVGGELDLLAQAGLALRAARAGGRGRWASYRYERHEPMAERMRLRAALDSAVAGEEFTVRYQPIVALTGGHTVGLEALVRWRHPTRGLLSPSDFIEQAEETGRIGPIGDWILRRAIAVAATWHRADPENSPYLSVNVSARQFQPDGFAAQVTAILDEAGLPPRKLMLELTESALMRDDDVWAELTGLHEVGVRLAIDDFGTGFSSLDYLQQAPFERHQDRQIVRRVAGHLPPAAGAGGRHRPPGHPAGPGSGRRRYRERRRPDPAGRHGLPVRTGLPLRRAADQQRGQHVAAGDACAGSAGARRYLIAGMSAPHRRT